MNEWDIEQVLGNPELGGFVEGENRRSVEENNNHNKLNNARGVTCPKCGNLMLQTSSNCYECHNCAEKRGGCGL